ncbi:MAG: ATP-binding cassette domain-containing protein [Deltaproteobacteria bacterium]|nr:ATP-binding cassette domain-containing protein [Deltaproteobacteria bacterium]MBW2071172.1 ATP-binding cassette domain-containing protein [Deltaproteobacteria bacterium]
MVRENIVDVKDLSKKFCRDLRRSLWYGLEDIAREMTGRPPAEIGLRQQEFWALKGITFQVKRGECLGLIGRNGAGKSTILKLLHGLIKPSGGRIAIHGSVGALIELGAGFNPILTGRENIYINASLLGISKKKVTKLFDQIVAFAEIDDFIDAPVQSYSSGMQVRLGFAIAAHINPDLLLVDEVLAVGDITFQRKCLQYMTSYLEKGGSIILVSHNMHLIQSICHKCLVLDHGRVRFNGLVTDAISTYYNIHFLLENNNSAISPNKIADKQSIVIEKVDMIPADGGQVKTGQDVYLTLHYQSAADLGEITWGFSIWTADQRTRIATCTAKHAQKSYKLFKGKGQLRCKLRSLPLVAGSYVVKAGIYDTKTSWPIARKGWDDIPGYFEVKPSGSEVDNRRMIDGDIVIMNVEWITQNGSF